MMWVYSIMNTVWLGLGWSWFGLILVWVDLICNYYTGKLLDYTSNILHRVFQQYKTYLLVGMFSEMLSRVISQSPKGLVCLVNEDVIWGLNSHAIFYLYLSPVDCWCEIGQYNSIQLLGLIRFEPELTIQNTYEMFVHVSIC